MKLKEFKQTKQDQQTEHTANNELITLMKVNRIEMSEREQSNLFIVNRVYQSDEDVVKI